MAEAFVILKKLTCDRVYPRLYFLTYVNVSENVLSQHQTLGYTDKKAEYYPEQEIMPANSQINSNI
jgi:hypothetical protein